MGALRLSLIHGHCAAARSAPTTSGLALVATAPVHRLFAASFIVPAVSRSWRQCWLHHDAHPSIRVRGSGSSNDARTVASLVTRAWTHGDLPRTSRGAQPASRNGRSRAGATPTNVARSAVGAWIGLIARGGLEPPAALSSHPPHHRPASPAHSHGSAAGGARERAPPVPLIRHPPAGQSDAVGGISGAPSPPGTVS